MRLMLLRLIGIAGLLLFAVALFGEVKNIDIPAEGKVKLLEIDNELNKLAVTQERLTASRKALENKKLQTFAVIAKDLVGDFTGKKIELTPDYKVQVEDVDETSPDKTEE